MIIGTVRGDIVSTINHPFYAGKRLLVVEKEDSAGKPGGYDRVDVEGQNVSRNRRPALP